MAARATLWRAVPAWSARSNLSVIPRERISSLQVESVRRMDRSQNRFLMHLMITYFLENRSRWRKDVFVRLES
jgi:hypothetical protein